MRFLHGTIVVALIAVPTTAESGDWPQFRGPTGQGHAEQAIALEWGEGPNVQWEVAVPGRGWSSPVVVDGRVWLTTAVTEADRMSLRVLAFDSVTGERLVDVEAFGLDDPELLNLKNSHASPTPVVEGDRVYVHFGASGTAALTTAGEVVWRKRFAYVSQHGNGGSPILHDGLLIFSCDGYDRSFVIALDAETGDTRWRTDRRQPFSQAYSTPLVIEVGDHEQLVSVGAFQTVALDPETGAEIWRVEYPDDGFSTVPRPVFGHGLVFVVTGFNQPVLLAIRPDGAGNVTATHVEWKRGQSVPLTPSPILVGDDLYTVSDVGVVSRLDARTGEEHWRGRIAGNYSASPLLAGGYIFFQSEEGLTSVIEPGTAFDVVRTNRVDGATLASMAVDDGILFLRSDSALYRIGR
jgi:outer membrane protein assembly factor BamB